jgi:hypothetical protein
MSVVGSCSASHLDFFFKFCVVLKDCLYIYMINDYNVVQFSEVGKVVRDRIEWKPASIRQKEWGKANKIGSMWSGC